MFVWIFLVLKIAFIECHGWLDVPVARSSAWLYNSRFNFVFPNYFLHSQMNCGGFGIFIDNGWIFS